MNDVPHLADPLPPRPKSQFLADALVHLGKRRRAIRHKVGRITVEKVLERTGSEEHEKLEVSSDVGSARLRLFLWDDRWVFVDARIATKGGGWAWEFTYQGRLVGSDAHGLVEGLEASIDATFDQSSEELERVWKPLLAAGPRVAR